MAINDLKLAPETSATLSGTTNDPALLNQTTNSGKSL